MSFGRCVGVWRLDVLGVNKNKVGGDPDIAGGR